MICKKFINADPILPVANDKKTVINARNVANANANDSIINPRPNTGISGIAMMGTTASNTRISLGINFKKSSIAISHKGPPIYGFDSIHGSIFVGRVKIHCA
jgi:hypothetical protein